MKFSNYFFHPSQLKQLIVIGITLVFMSKSYAEMIALGFIQLVESFIVILVQMRVVYDFASQTKM